MLYGFGLLRVLACELFRLGQALAAMEADNEEGAYGAYAGCDEQVGAQIQGWPPLALTSMVATMGVIPDAKMPENW